MSYKYKKTRTVQLKFSHKEMQENMVVAHGAIQKYIHIQSVLTNLMGNGSVLHRDRHTASSEVHANSADDSA
jgi:hypothetical protein